MLRRNRSAEISKYHSSGDVCTHCALVRWQIVVLLSLSALQNAFANSSSSLIQSKVTGNIVFVLLPPISHAEFYFAYMSAAVLRGVEAKR